MNAHLKILLEQLVIILLGLVFFLLFGFSVSYLPKILPPSLGFLAYALTILSLIGSLLVILGSWGIGPVGKRRNKVAIEMDKLRRKKYEKAKQPWER